MCKASISNLVLDAKNRCDTVKLEVETDQYPAQLHKHNAVRSWRTPHVLGVGPDSRPKLSIARPSSQCMIMMSELLFVYLD